MLNDMLPPSGSAFSSGGAGWAQPNAANDINSKKLVKNSQTFRIPDTSMLIDAKHLAKFQYLSLLE
jgi:hypothetical protein